MIMNVYCPNYTRKRLDLMYWEIKFYSDLQWPRKHLPYIYTSSSQIKKNCAMTVIYTICIPIAVYEEYQDLASQRAITLRLVLIWWQDQGNYTRPDPYGRILCSHHEKYMVFLNNEPADSTMFC